MYPKPIEWNVRNNLCILKKVFWNSKCMLSKNFSNLTNFIQHSCYSMYLHTKYIKVFKIELIRCSNNNLHFDKRCFQSVGRGPFIAVVNTCVPWVHINILAAIIDTAIIWSKALRYTTLSCKYKQFWIGFEAWLKVI